MIAREDRAGRVLGGPGPGGLLGPFAGHQSKPSRLPPPCRPSVGSVAPCRMLEKIAAAALWSSYLAARDDRARRRRLSLSRPSGRCCSEVRRARFGPGLRHVRSRREHNRQMHDPCEYAPHSRARGPQAPWLSADDVDRWLADKAKTLSTDTLQILHSILRRSITGAQARDKVKRNVVLLCDVPQGQEGRPSKSLTYDQANALLAAAESRPLYAYIVVSLLTGARTEELRALTWSHVDLDATPPVIMVWRSVRAGGDTKTRKSRRTLELPQRCTDALCLHRDRQDQIRKRAGDRWHDNDLVFASRVGTALWAGNVRRSFRAILTAAGLIRGLDAARAAAQLRLADVRRRCPDREDRSHCRPHRDDHHRNRLPQADSSRGHWRRGSHGQPVPQAGHRCLQ